MLDLSNYINGEVKVGFLSLVVIISDKKIEEDHSLTITTHTSKWNSFTL